MLCSIGLGGSALGYSRRENGRLAKGGPKPSRCCAGSNSLFEHSGRKASNPTATRYPRSSRTSTVSSTVRFPKFLLNSNEP